MLGTSGESTQHPKTLEDVGPNGGGPSTCLGDLGEKGGARTDVMGIYSDSWTGGPPLALPAPPDTAGGEVVIIAPFLCTGCPAGSQRRC